MADKQITDYTEETSIVSGDWFLVQKGATGQYVKVDASNILPAGSVTSTKLANSAVTDAKRASMSFTDVYHNTTQSINTATWTAALLNSETTDTDGWHSTVTNTSRITITESGNYLVIGGFRIPSVADGNLVGGLIAINGTRIESTGGSFSSATGSEYIPVTMLKVLTAGDYIEVHAYQASGGAANIADARLTVIKLSN